MLSAKWNGGHFVSASMSIFRTAGLRLSDLRVTPTWWRHLELPSWRGQQAGTIVNSVQSDDKARCSSLVTEDGLLSCHLSGLNRNQLLYVIFFHQLVHQLQAELPVSLSVVPGSWMVLGQSWQWYNLAAHR